MKPSTKATDPKQMFAAGAGFDSFRVAGGRNPTQKRLQIR